jgi:hypothetical protein
MNSSLGNYNFHSHYPGKINWFFVKNRHQKNNQGNMYLVKLDVDINLGANSTDPNKVSVKSIEEFSANQSLLGGEELVVEYNRTIAKVKDEKVVNLHCCNSTYQKFCTCQYSNGDPISSRWIYSMLTRSLYLPGGRLGNSCDFNSPGGRLDDSNNFNLPGGRLGNSNNFNLPGDRVDEDIREIQLGYCASWNDQGRMYSSSRVTLEAEVAESGKYLIVRETTIINADNSGTGKSMPRERKVFIDHPALQCYMSYIKVESSNSDSVLMRFSMNNYRSITDGSCGKELEKLGGDYDVLIVVNFFLETFEIIDILSFNDRFKRNLGDYFIIDNSCEEFKCSSAVEKILDPILKISDLTRIILECCFAF